jgi:hypothetical protein
MATVVEYLLSNCKALSSNPRTAKKKKKTRKKKVFKKRRGGNSR